MCILFEPSWKPKIFWYKMKGNIIEIFKFSFEKWLHITSWDWIFGRYIKNLNLFFYKINKQSKNEILERSEAPKMSLSRTNMLYHDIKRVDYVENLISYDTRWKDLYYVVISRSQVFVDIFHLLNPYLLKLKLNSS